MVRIGTGGEIRTPINGFGDRYSTLELHPFIELLCFATTSHYNLMTPFHRRLTATKHNNHFPIWDCKSTK